MRNVLLLVVGAALVVLVLYAIRTPTPLREGQLTGLAAQLMTCLPGDLTEPQRAEIEGLLRRFQSRAQAGLVRSEHQREVQDLLKDYVQRGEITRGELNLLMARVGYYSHAGEMADSATIHPLLIPTENLSDSTR
ncbi:MAG: hypothetical protein OEN01_09840 [Candidatus Krumholzibacteria bacterium]|nr:hypothetical protein [Candidatus Krumholzibacteria bacterium]